MDLPLGEIPLYPYLESPPSDGSIFGGTPSRVSPIRGTLSGIPPRRRPPRRPDSHWRDTHRGGSGWHKKKPPFRGAGRWIVFTCAHMPYQTEILPFRSIRQSHKRFATNPNETEELHSVLSPH